MLGPQTRPWQRGAAADILAHVALRGGVEGGELHIAGVLVPHLVKHFLKGVESAVRRIHVVLVHLQGKRDSHNESFWKAVAQSRQWTTPRRGEGYRYRVNLLSGEGHKVQP